MTGIKANSNFTSCAKILNKVYTVDSTDNV